MNAKRFKNTRLLCTLGTMAGIGLLTVSTAAQDPCYRVVDLGVLGFTPTNNEIFGINNANQAVFTALVGGEKHAMLYLPVGAYDLAAGVHDLHDLAGAAITGDESAAHDINEAGIVVGWAEIQGEQRAFVWKLNIDPFEFIDLGTFLAGDSSIAFAINDDTPFPIVVGDGNLLFDCQCEDEPPPFNDEVRRAFALALEDPPDPLDDAALLDQDPGLTCHPATWARDVKSPAGLTVAGFSTVGTADCFVPVTCGVGNAATAWIDPTPGNNPGAALAVLPPDGPFDSGGTQARGVSDTGALVGYGYTHSVAQCFQHAVYWDTAAADPPLDLGKATGIDASSQSLAVRINNNASPDTLQAVGWQFGTPDVAFLWECDSGCDLLASWSATDLNETLNLCSGPWKILQAHDINDSGWIIGVGESSPPVDRAVILAPLATCPPVPECLGDIDGNEVVGATDLLALLVAWGPCLPPPAACDADLNCDGTVGSVDLLIILTNWGPCGSLPVSPPEDIWDCINRFCCDPEDLLALEKCICSVDPECDPSP